MYSSALFFLGSVVVADTYQVQGAAGNFSIYNVDNNTGYNTFDLTDRVISKLSSLGPPESFGSTLFVGFSDLRVTNVNGDEITFKSTQANITGEVSDGFYAVYGMDFKLNAVTGEITEFNLVSFDPDLTERAIDLGFEVRQSDLQLIPDYEFQTYNSNFLNSGDNLTNGGLVITQLTGEDGTSIIRQEDDGTVHLGENSLVFAERGVAGFTEDTIYSSTGVLQIGDGPSHRTVFQGVVEVPDPTSPSHAANKRYVDGYVNGSMAMSIAMSSLPQSVNDKVMFGFGTGFLGGQTAFAIGLSKGVGGSGYSFNANLGYSDLSKVGAGFGLGIEF